MYVQTSDQPSLELGFGDYSCNWGVHIAGLYETEAERDAIVFGYLATGATAGDLQLYCPYERSREEFRERFANAYPGLAENLTDRETFRFDSTRDLYYPTGTFSPWDMDRGLQSIYDSTRLPVPRNIRATADMSWARQSIPGREHLMAYEARLNYFIPGKPWISICLYHLGKFDGATILNVLRTHPWVINQGVLTENPYFQDPGHWLQKNAPEFLPA